MGENVLLHSLEVLEVSTDIKPPCTSVPSYSVLCFAIQDGKRTRIRLQRLRGPLSACAIVCTTSSVAECLFNLECLPVECVLCCYPFDVQFQCCLGSQCVAEVVRPHHID